MQQDCREIALALESWYDRENGQYLLESTRRAIQEALDTAFGYHILELGVSGQQQLCDGSRINHRLFCAQRQGSGVSLVADPEELPLESDSVDAIIAHHCLEFATHPHQVLREIQRVLTPQGQLLAIGFNPYSLLGSKIQLRKVVGDALWSACQPVSEHRLTDWLRLLGFEVQGAFRLYGLPPTGRGRLRRVLARGDRWIARHNLPLGGVYILHATKQVAGLHRPRRLLLPRRSRLVGLVPKPTPTPTPVPLVVPAPLHDKHGRPTPKGNVAA
jgi:SAM-dependent methyltransferase